MIRRRSMLMGVAASLAAPAVVRADSIMQVRTPRLWRPEHITAKGFPNRSAAPGSTWHQVTEGCESRWVCGPDGVWSSAAPVPKPFLLYDDLVQQEIAQDLRGLYPENAERYLKSLRGTPGDPNPEPRLVVLKEEDIQLVGKRQRLKWDWYETLAKQELPDIDTSLPDLVLEPDESRLKRAHLRMRDPWAARVRAEHNIVIT